MNSPRPCTCAEPNADCLRAGLPMVGRLWELCAGVRCPPELSAACRRVWDRLGLAGCAFRGPPTGALRTCDSCRGRVQLRVFACHHPGRTAEPTTTEPDCRRCPDYQEKP